MSVTRNAFLTVVGMLVGSGLAALNRAPPDSGKLMAQKVVEEIKAIHTEITNLGLAASRSDREGCKTIAATEAREIAKVRQG